MQRNHQYVSSWLISLALLIIAMITLGGYTRLSGSGLSIVEWAPISGILPPLTESAWQTEFDKYKLFPEYKLVNHAFTLTEFKFIFIIEFLHRILGRIIGLTMALPLIYFYLKRYITKEELPKYLCMFALLLLQGFMGWYMVKSGLAKDPHVSHYRLSVHLIMAVLLYSLIIWQTIPKLPSKNKTLNNQFKILLAIIYLQVFFGGMVAGLKAGMIYNTFPLMGNSFIPAEINFNDLNDPVTVQFIHRILAYAVFLICAYLSYCLYNLGEITKALCLFGACFLQVLLGIVTLIYIVPVFWALVHQLGALLLITVNIYILRKT
jgi:cytochrome c oxidase assembly protein subunit 15